MSEFKKVAILAAVAAGSAAATVALHPSSQVLAQASPSSTVTAQNERATTVLEPGISDPNIFASLADKVVPSVVNISAVSAPERPRGRRGYRTPDEMFREFFGPGWGEEPGAFDSRPAPRAASLGTGFVIDSSGIILTNHHVVADANDIKITFTESPDEKPTPGKVIGRDPDLDVALIKVDTNRKLTALPLGDSDVLKVGEYVAAVGNPFGQGHSFTHGIISAKGRTSPGVPLATYLQTDAPINPGNSGGPLLNLRGEVIGINNAIDARAQGIGFAIPINVVKTILPELQSRGKIARGYIGVVVGALSPEMAEKINVSKDTQAPLVVQVEPGSPAYKAGIRPYDLISEVEGKPVASPSDLTTRITALPEGKTVSMKILRADQTQEVKVKLGRRPDMKSDS